MRHGQAASGNVVTALPGTIDLATDTRVIAPTEDWSGLWSPGDVIQVSLDSGAFVYLCLGTFPAGVVNLPDRAVPLCEYYVGDRVTGAAASLLGDWSSMGWLTSLSTTAASGPAGVRAPYLTAATGGTLSLRLLYPDDDGGSPMLSVDVYATDTSRALGAVLLDTVTYSSPDMVWLASGLNAGTTYAIYVIDINKPTLCIDTHEHSPVVRYTTLGGTAPGRPSNLLTSSSTGGSVTIQFDTPVDTGGSAITHFEAVFSLACANELANVSLSAMPVVFVGGPLNTTFTVYGLLPSTGYCTKVRAISAFGTGMFSAAYAPTTRQKTIPGAFFFAGLLVRAFDLCVAMPRVTPLR